MNNRNQVIVVVSIELPTDRKYRTFFNYEFIEKEIQTLYTEQLISRREKAVYSFLAS